MLSGRADRSPPWWTDRDSRQSAGRPDSSASKRAADSVSCAGERGDGVGKGERRRVRGECRGPPGYLLEADYPQHVALAPVSAFELHLGPRAGFFCGFWGGTNPLQEM